jgi:hypothetical protein
MTQAEIIVADFLINKKISKIRKYNFETIKTLKIKIIILRI